ncbi:MAG TPA: hypothetical protein PLD77_02270 [Candidatus Dojkabacteria bacterium]|nr:hypothetical protein [Candidatus Dojkabacteria bacterium]
MKIQKLLLGFFLSLGIFLIIPQTKVTAAEFHFKSYSLNKEETVKDDVYIFGESANIEGAVYGDLVIVADSVKVNGTVTGDLYICGNQVNIDPIAYGNVFVVGNDMTIDGILNNNLYVLGKSLSFLGQATKDVISITSQNSFDGYVGDDLRSFGLTSTINSIIKGDLVLVSEQSTVNEQNVEDNIYYETTIQSIASSQGVDINTGAKIKVPDIIANPSWGVKGLVMLTSFVTLLLTGVFLVWLTPVKTVQIKRRITDSPIELIKSLLAGIIIAFVVPFPLFIMLMSIIGTPIALIVSAFLLFVLLFGRIWVELAFGTEILRLFGIEEYRPYKSLLVGRILSIGVNLIPRIGVFYNIIVIFTALGAMVRMKKDLFTAPKEITPVKKKKTKKSNKEE